MAIQIENNRAFIIRNIRYNFKVFEQRNDRRTAIHLVAELIGIVIITDAFACTFNAEKSIRGICASRFSALYHNVAGNGTAGNRKLAFPLCKLVVVKHFAADRHGKLIRQVCRAAQAIGKICFIVCAESSIRRTLKGDSCKLGGDLHKL